MNINSQSTKYNTPNFKAIPQGKYKLFKDSGEVTIYQLEQKDIPLLENFISNRDEFVKKHKIDDEARECIVMEAFREGIDFLKRGDEEKKVKVLMAVSNNEPCGIIIGNASKIDKSGKIHYSSRKNHGKNETELDVFATWNNNLKGVGKALIDEYFIKAKKDGFKQIYVRAEVPQNAPNTIKFYSGCGFTEMNGEKQQLDLKKGDYQYVAGEYFDADDLIMPMKATSSRIDKTIEEISTLMKRKESSNKVSEDISFMAVG